MNKNCIVTVRGVQRIASDPEEPEAIEITTTGWYEMKDGKHVLEYDEVFEEIPGKTHNILTFQNGSALVSKSGQVNTDMLFEVGRVNMADYETPFGMLDMSFEATEVTVSKNEENLLLNISYKMNVAGHVTAECKLDVNIRFQKKVTKKKAI